MNCNSKTMLTMMSANTDKTTDSAEAGASADGSGNRGVDPGSASQRVHTPLACED